MKKPILLLALLILCFSSCKKDDDVAVDGPTLLKTGSWKRSLYDLNAATNPVGNVTYYARLDCETDDTYTFKDNGQLVVDRGQKKCSDTEISPETLTYSVDLDKKTITLNKITYVLTEITKTQLKYYTPAAANSQANNVIYVYQHQ